MKTHYSLLVLGVGTLMLMAGQIHAVGASGTRRAAGKGLVAAGQAFEQIAGKHIGPPATRQPFITSRPR